MKYLICIAMIGLILVAGCTSTPTSNETNGVNTTKEIGIAEMNVITTEALHINNPLQITYYYMSTCSHCTQMSADFDNLTKYYYGEIVITKHEVSKDSIDFENDAIKYNNSYYSVPFIIVENTSFIGYWSDTQFKIGDMIMKRREL